MSGGDHDDEGRVTHVVAAEANAVWHKPLVQIIAGTLSGSTAQTAGMTRLEAISGKTVGSEKLWMGETHVAPATSWLPLGGQLGFAMHTVSATGDLHTEFVYFPDAARQEPSAAAPDR